MLTNCWWHNSCSSSTPLDISSRKCGNGKEISSLVYNLNTSTTSKRMAIDSRRQKYTIGTLYFGTTFTISNNKVAAPWDICVFWTSEITKQVWSWCGKFEFYVDIHLTLVSIINYLIHIHQTCLCVLLVHAKLGQHHSKCTWIWNAD